MAERDSVYLGYRVYIFGLYIDLCWIPDSKRLVFAMEIQT